MLSDKTKAEIVRLRVEEGLPSSSIAERLGVSIPTVRKRLIKYPMSEANMREFYRTRKRPSPDRCKRKTKPEPEEFRCAVCDTPFIRYKRSTVTCKRSCRGKFTGKVYSKPSNSEGVTSFRKRQKLKAVMYKGGKCRICFYSRCAEALEFHHLEPGKKDFTISHSIRAWPILKAELDKCLLVCCRCHREIHACLVECPKLEPIEEKFEVVRHATPSVDWHCDR